MLLTKRVPGLLYTYRYTVYLSLVLAATILYFLFKWHLLCTNYQARQHLSHMCKLYEEGRAAGTLCGPICSSENLQAVTCHPSGSSKETVFSAELHETELIFKEAPTDVMSLSWYDNGVLTYPTEKEFVATIRAIVRNKLNVTLSYESAVRLSRLKPSHEEKDMVKRQIEMDNVWVLAQDSEYLLSTIYADKDVFPQILGTCGSYFATEHVESIRDVTASLLAITDTKEDWSKRIKVSLQILDLLEEFDGDFQEPYHLCDMKLEHFGFAERGTKLKFLNLQGVFSKSIINSIIRETPTCTQDKDCDFYDCRSRCAKSLNKCVASVSNNNLQIVCERIFLGWRFANTVIVPGLLMSQHTPSDLAAILRQCANPHNEDGKPRATPEKGIKERLVNMLSEIDQRLTNDLLN